MKTVIRKLSDAEKIVFAYAALRWIELGGGIRRGSISFPEITTEDELNECGKLLEAMMFPDGERNIWVDPDA